MKKILFVLAAAFIFLSTNAQKGRLFDQQMIIKECTVDITTKGMLATTWVELEFYNNRDKEAEAHYDLQLNPGQAITGFQLMLGDTYRDGSIEERWKARQAYSSIVGKRMDPALLQMTGTNYYTLNIYPVAAKSSRKVKIKIEELLQCADAGLKYDLNVFANDSIVKLNVLANVSEQAYAPFCEYGILKNKKFDTIVKNFNLQTSFNNIKKPGAIAFLLPKQCAAINACMHPATGEFFLKTENKRGSEINIDIKKLRVYWDCSASMTEASRKEFIAFLSEVLMKYNTDELTIVPFNHRLYGEKIFSKAEIQLGTWKSVIKQIKFEGATQFGVLNFDTKDDLILVFTDGVNTWGERRPTEMKTPVTFITTNNYYNYYRNTDCNYYDDDIYYRGRFSNYKNYYLHNYYDDKKFDTAIINNLSKFTIGLLAVEDELGKKAIMQLPQNALPVMVVAGKLHPSSKKVILKYGFGNKVLFTQEFDIQNNFFGADFDKVKALVQFESLSNNNYWYNTLSFGIDNKIVTWQTSYIVLEKIEDYVKYNITPPADLLQKCLESGYVKTDYKQRFEYIKKTENLDMLKLVAAEYNKRFDLWGTATDKINIATVEKNYAVIEQDKNKVVAPVAQSTNQQKTINTLSTTAENTKALDEVIVVGYGTTSKRDFMGAASSVRSIKELRDIPSTSVPEALVGRLAGLQVTSSDGSPGAEYQLKIRGGTSITQSNEPLYIIDGVPVEDGLNSLALTDVESIDVLKDVGSTAIYGSRGSNGVIMVTTRSGRYNERAFNGYTKLKNQKDVGYMQLIKNASVTEKYDVYKELENGYEKNMVFYLDMALHFYEIGLTTYTDEMIEKAAEASNGDTYAQTAIAFVYEQMKQHDKAIEWYKNLIEDNPMQMRFVRDLAWAYYGNNQLDSAVKVLYNGITRYGYNWDVSSLKLKDMMLADMNMMIALNKNKIDISYIQQEIIKPITADSRIIIESNTTNLYDLSVKLPGKKELSISEPLSKTAARLQNIDNSLAEFQQKNAIEGKYKIKLKTYNQYNSASPSYVRIIKITDFGKVTQSIDTDIVSLCNQNGTVEIDDFKIEQKN